MKHLTLVLFLAVLFISCRERGKDGFVKSEYYSDGTLASEVSYIRDTVKHGPAKSFYKNGQLAEVGYYKNGKVNGLYIAYYFNGVVKEKGHYLQGDPLGSFYFYFPNGKLKLYHARDYKKDVFYVMKFDSLGRKIKEEGMIVSPTISSPTYKKQYATGDSLVLEYCIAEPPGYKVSVRAGHYLKGTVEGERLIGALVPLPIIKSLATYRLKFLEPGSYDIVCVGELLDTVSSLKKYDTSHTSFIVH